MRELALEGEEMKVLKVLWIAIGFAVCVLAMGCQSSSGGGGSGGVATYSPYCGDGSCNGSESSYDCAQDCGQASRAAKCGNGTCEAGESAASCPSDCKQACTDACSSDKCEDGQLVRCIKMATGCTGWGTPEACTGGKVCSQFASACTPCATSADCPTGEVCDAGSCGNPNGKKYVFSVDYAVVPVTDSAGTNWDPAGLPDPYVCLYLDETKVGCTAAKPDTLNPVWFASFEATVYTSQTIGFSIYDEDLASDDPMQGANYSNTAGILHAGGDSGPWDFAPEYSLTWSVKPKN